MATLRCQHYPDEHYLTLFNPETGFFVRAEEHGYGEPFCSAQGPEMIDISITNWCSRECQVCYRGASRSGVHMSLRDYETVVRQAARLGTMQVALGGGNPNEHPRTISFLYVPYDVWAALGGHYRSAFYSPCISTPYLELGDSLEIV